MLQHNLNIESTFSNRQKRDTLSRVKPPSGQAPLPPFRFPALFNITLHDEPRSNAKQRYSWIDCCSSL